MMPSIRGETACVLVIGLFLLLATSIAKADQQCVEMVGSLQAENKAGRPTQEVVEALLHDAEKVYLDGAQIVKQRPRTRAQSYAILDKDFHVEECHFQKALSLAAGDAVGQSQRFQSVLIRIGQFDNFIFGAVNEVVNCSNTEAGLRLKVSRELLDHAWMEFKGDPKQRDWDPNLDWKETREACSP
jgi:hypothetical protein